MADAGGHDRAAQVDPGTHTVQWMFPGADAPPAGGQTLEFWVSESASRNLALPVQRVAVEVAAQEAAKSSGALSPILDLVAQAGRERLSGSGDFGKAANGSGNRMVGLQVTVPLYTGGMREAREQEALRGINKARALADRTRQQVAQQTRARPGSGSPLGPVGSRHCHRRWCPHDRAWTARA